jgi:uncharacterized protein
MELRPDLQIADSVLAAFARRHGIARLALFGSVLRGDFDENSDVDILVEFEPGHTPGLFALAAMERELEAIIGRTVDLRTYHDLSRYFRDNVVASAQHRDIPAAIGCPFHRGQRGGRQERSNHPRALQPQPL